MRVVLLIGLLSALCPAAEPKSAVEPKLPDSAKRVLDTISAEILAAKQKAAKELQRVSLEVGRSGDSAGAEKVKNEAIILEDEIKIIKALSGWSTYGTP